MTTDGQADDRLSFPEYGSSLGCHGDVLTTAAQRLRERKRERERDAETESKIERLPG